MCLMSISATDPGSAAVAAVLMRCAGACPAPGVHLYGYEHTYHCFYAVSADCTL
jgi:hypothetical protein